MASIYDTIYPKFKKEFTQAELNEIYTPTEMEVILAEKSTVRQSAKLLFLISLKCFQRLGYFLPISNIPEEIIYHISKVLDIKLTEKMISNYGKSGSRQRHFQAIRAFLGVSPFDSKARHLIVVAIGKAAKTKEEPTDLINIAIEELIKNSYELPAFSTIERAVNRIRVSVNRSFYRKIFDSLDEEEVNKINNLLENDEDLKSTPWNMIKKESSSPTLNHLKEIVNQLSWLKEQSIAVNALQEIPYVKIKQFSLEAKALNATKMRELEPLKRYTLVASLIYIQTSATIDDVAEMFIKRMNSVHNKAKAALEQYRKDNVQTTNNLILALKDIVVAYESNATKEEKFLAIDTLLSKHSSEILEKCDKHNANSRSHYSFLWQYYKSNRKILFGILKICKIYSTNKDQSLEKSITFLQENENKRADWLDIIKIKNKGKSNEIRTELIDLKWIPEAWWKLITGKTNKKEIIYRIDRRYFEIFTFTQIMWELKSGDLFIVGADKYSDYREQLVSWEEYDKGKELFGQQVNLPVISKEFVLSLKSKMEKAIADTDKTFLDNQFVRIVNNEPIISKIEKIKYPEQKKEIESLIAERLEPINILDIITDTDYWLKWTKHFGLLSGHESKMENPTARYILATFCYGCNIGPTQTVRSLEELTRKHLSWTNQQHITEDKIDKAVFQLINAYNSLDLPRIWGSGKSSSTDGTKWELYDKNLLSEYHIRYGGYGGIGYYHVSDKYIALFSHFIPCGTWEGVYLLDILQNNQSEIQPDTFHGDTQSQNGPIFGLSYLLGINLMPRIRNWKDLTLYRPSEDKKYKHIDGLFTNTIDWDLIESNFDSMLRVALSIKEGKITPSTILKKLGTYSRKNKLYLAFRELGRVIRTIYLMKYISDVELRSTIQAATNKSEGFNGFAKWIAFGNDGVIRENSRDEQRKIIKYNHLVANCLIFYNACMLTHIIGDLMLEGYEIEDETIASLSPYITHHINRFGKYKLDLDRKPPYIVYEFRNLKKI